MENNPHLGQYGQPVYSTLATEAEDWEIDWLVAKKKEWGLQREALIALQKQAAAAKDYESAKHYKTDIAELMQLQRAVSLFLGHLAATPPGDSPYRPMKNWGVELAAACRTVDSMFMYGEKGEFKESSDV